jgi:hypothetical protein
MESSTGQRNRRNVSFSLLYDGKEHRFVKAEQCPSLAGHIKRASHGGAEKRNFFNSPRPQGKADNNERLY